MKRIILLIFAVILLTTSSAYAKDISIYVELPDGQKVSLNGLTRDQRSNTINNLEKTVKANELEATIPKIVKIANKSPEELDKWRKLIVGTIKDTCDDLNVTVNEFVTTPVGIGVVGIIAYKVFGKDLISAVIRITIAGIMWFLITIVLAITTRYFLGATLVYETIIETPQENDKPIITKSNPARTLRYPWESGDARCWCGIVIGLFFFINCITTAIIML